MRSISYEKQTFDSPNPLARFAHRTRYKNALGLVNSASPPGAIVLDFGAGTGEFLHQIGLERPDLRRFGIEPNGPLAYPEIATRGSLDEFADESVDLLCAFEVFEHLEVEHIEDFVRQSRRICKGDGKIVISVPIMNGVALPIKEASKSILFWRPSDYSFTELLRGTFGLPVDRTEEILYSHKGFDHRTLFDRLGRDFRSVDRFYSPVSALPWWCNSQAFFVFSRT